MVNTCVRTDVDIALFNDNHCTVDFIRNAVDFLPIAY